MEGDARGQVGGMEMGKAERERLAGESKTWRCSGCGGRSNEDILKEEGGEVIEGKENKHEVPDELKFGFRDEMGKDEGGESKKEVTERPESKDTSVPPGASVPPATMPAGPSTAVTVPPASSSSTALQPTRTIPVATTAQTPVHMAPQIHQAQSDGVPAWIDKAIAALVAALAFMVMRKILL